MLGPMKSTIKRAFGTVIYFHHLSFNPGLLFLAVCNHEKKKKKKKNFKAQFKSNFPVIYFKIPQSRVIISIAFTADKYRLTSFLM